MAEVDHGEDRIIAIIPVHRFTRTTVKAGGITIEGEGVEVRLFTGAVMIPLTTYCREMVRMCRELFLGGDN